MYQAFFKFTYLQVVYVQVITWYGFLNNLAQANFSFYFSVASKRWYVTTSKSTKVDKMKPKCC